MKKFHVELSPEINKRIELIKVYQKMIDDQDIEWSERLFAYQRLSWNVQRLRELGLYVWRQIGDVSFKIAVECE